jgi:hypothetical protein
MPGDIVLRPSDDGSRYTLSTLGEAPQVLCFTYEEAAAQADRFARARRLDVWQTDDDRTFQRIREFRLPRSSSG